MALDQADLSAQSVVPYGGWGLEDHEGVKGHLICCLGVALQAMLGCLSLVCFFPYSHEYPGWELVGGGIGWIAHFLNTFQHPDRLVEIVHSTTDEKYDHATFVPEFSLEASRSSFSWCGGGALRLCLPLHAQPRGRATLFLLLLLSQPLFPLS